VKHEYGFGLIGDVAVSKYDAVVLAVAHDEYKKLSFNHPNQVIFDIKSILDNADGRL
ncbi:MAG: Vi polysaccharide biosynthesis UDP-N-acetylglucosamine C-6 dehydrogenase TviB, partial [Epsilonproteobacteria bacterium]|nr:Vi polysaccharide biosynthesis UDP-N-acetylglucosamine C-6 dehydrogenase TviB [Campylobacterota bacterium]